MERRRSRGDAPLFHTPRAGAERCARTVGQRVTTRPHVLYRLLRHTLGGGWRSAGSPGVASCVRRWTLLSLLIASLGAGCQTFESGAVWDITIRNDTRRAVVVRDCLTERCQRFRYTRRIRPGRSKPAFDFGDGDSWWTVSTVRRQRLGCLLLTIRHRAAAYVLKVSDLRACPHPEARRSLAKEKPPPTRRRSTPGYPRRLARGVEAGGES